jgi:hypothetical protein
MPLYEARGFRTRSTLTQKEQDDALAAIYGLPPQPTPSMQSNTQISHEDAERMRAILAQFDSNNKVGMQTIDLNNPPKVPYVHQAFGRTVYHHATGRNRAVHDPVELAAALEAGWDVKPPVTAGEESEVELDPEIEAELAATRAKAKRVAAEKLAAEKAAAKKKT